MKIGNTKTEKIIQSSKIQDTRYKIQDSRSKIQDTRYKIQDSRAKNQSAAADQNSKLLALSTEHSLLCTNH
jgi:hypothetical protein